MRHPPSYFHYCGLHYNYCIVMLIVVKGFKLCIAQCCSQVLMRRSIIPTFNNFRKLKTFFSQRFLLTLTHPSYLKIRIAVRNARFERHLSWGWMFHFSWFFSGAKVDEDKYTFSWVTYLHKNIPQIMLDWNPLIQYTIWGLKLCIGANLKSDIAIIFRLYKKAHKERRGVWKNFQLGSVFSVPS